MIQKLFKAAFVCPHFILMILGGISALALTAALISQYGFGMHPCELCIYQRIPYALVIILAIIGIIATKQAGKLYGAYNIFLSAIAFLINSGIAFYHVGVEQHWWASGCTINLKALQSVDDLQAAIMNAPKVSCDQIPFELFGISMAGYNFILCGLLGIYALIATVTVLRHKSDRKV